MVPSASWNAASIWSQVTGSRSLLPRSGCNGAGSVGAVIGRHRKLPPLWSTLSHGPSCESAGALNRTPCAGSIGLGSGSAKIRLRAAAFGGGTVPSARSPYSSGVNEKAELTASGPAALATVYEQETTIESWLPGGPPGTVRDACTYRLTPEIGPSCAVSTASTWAGT